MKRDSTKSRMVSMRMTEKQYQYLEDVAKRIQKETGLKVTRASIMLKLMELGAPYLNREFPTDEES